MTDHWPTNSMEQSPSWKANSLSASQEIHCPLWNLKVHYCVHKGLLLDPIDVITKYMFTNCDASSCFGFKRKQSWSAVNFCYSLLNGIWREWWIVKDVQESACGLFWHIVLAVAWRNSGGHRNPQDSRSPGQDSNLHSRIQRKSANHLIVTSCDSWIFPPDTPLWYLKYA